MTVFIVGNSHTVAVKQSYDRLDPEVKSRSRSIFFWAVRQKTEVPFAVVQNNRVEFPHEEDAAEVRRIRGKPYFEVEGPEDVWGLYVTTHYFVLHDKWKDVEPSAVCRPGAQPVSASMLNSLYSYLTSKSCNLLLQLRSIGLRVFVIAFPFPRPENPAISGNLIRSEVAVHIDQVGRAFLRDWSTKHGVDFIEAPPECRTAEGFLKPEFRALVGPCGQTDYTHANEAYGALMLRRILAYLKTGDQNADISPLDGDGAVPG